MTDNLPSVRAVIDHPTSHALPVFFQEYDIRGRFPEEANLDTARSIGKRLAGMLGRAVLVARDTRQESLEFERALVGALRASGVFVEVIGIAPTPALEFCARRYRRSGLAVTPSHNPLGYVGLKGFSPEGRLFRDEWVRLAHSWTAPLPADDPTSRGLSMAGPRRPRPIGTRWIEEYLRFAASGVRTRLHVVVDCRGGATAKLAPRALRYTGARVSAIDAEFSSTFAGRSPEPNPRDLAALGKRVREERADLGATFDGDGDRVAFVDEAGHAVAPEVVALVLRSRWKSSEFPLVATADTSQRLRQFGRVRYCRVGSYHVRSMIRQVRGRLGFEGSGHYYIGSGSGSSDGIRTACILLHSLTARRIRLAEEVARIGPFPRLVRTIAFPTMIEARHVFDDCVRRVGPRGRREFGGLRLSGPPGWLYLRPSNTQPLLRVTIEPKEPFGISVAQDWFESLPELSFLQNR